MRYPKFLEKNGTIGFVAPAFGCAEQPYRARFDRAREELRQLGYGEKLGPNCYLGEGIGISSTPEKCAQELMQAYLDPESDVLMACGGGELMCEVISRLDFEKLSKAQPKWYLGYSDNTNFIFLLAVLCDVAAVYGPHAGSFGITPWHESLKDTLAVLGGTKRELQGYDRWEREGADTAENPLAPLNLTQERILKLWVPWERAPGFSDEDEEKNADSDGAVFYESDEESGRLVENATHFHGNLQIRGRMIGGCMDCLVTLLGTRFDQVSEFQERYRQDGFLWFLEACDLNVFGIRRAMWQMEEAGWFRYVKGFLIGRPLCHGQEIMGLDAYEAVLATARKYRVPVIMDADIGHLAPSMPIVCGSMAQVEVLGNDIRIRYDYS